MSSGSEALSNNVILDIFTNRNLFVYHLVFKELINALLSFNPLLKAVANNGPIDSAFIWGQYYRKHFAIVDPIEDMLKSETNKTFQYIPILKSL